MIRTLLRDDSRWFSLYALFSSLAFETPILTFYLRQRELSFTQISGLFSIFAVSVFVFEYLTGVLADRFGRKLCLLASGAALIAGELLFILGASFWMFAAAMGCMALAVAFKSGADTALIYDWFAGRGQSERIDDYLSGLGSVLLVAEAAAFPLGSLLAQASLLAPFIATVGMAAVSLGFLSRIKEPVRSGPGQPAGAIITKSALAAIRSPLVTALFLAAVLLFPCYHILSTFLQPYLEAHGVPVALFGLFYTGLTLFQAAGTRMAAGLVRRVGYGQGWMAAAVGIGIGFGLMGLPYSGLEYLAPAWLGVSFGLFYTVGSLMLNHATASDTRATTISLQHALTKISQAGLFPLFGALADVQAIAPAFLLLGLSVLVFCGLLFVLFRTPLLRFRRAQSVL